MISRRERQEGMTMAKEMTWMAKTATTELLNNRVAALMRERHVCACDAIFHIIETEEGANLIDRTNPEDTDGGDVRLYRLQSQLLVNVWITSSHGDARDITDPDMYLRGDAAIGIDNQPLDWGWPERAD